MENISKKKKKKTCKVTIDTIQKEYDHVHKKKKTDIYIRYSKPINIYQKRIVKLLNTNANQVTNVIEGNNKNVNNSRNMQNEQVCIYAVGNNIIRSFYLLQDIVSYYCKFLASINSPKHSILTNRTNTVGISTNNNNNNNNKTTNSKIPPKIKHIDYSGHLDININSGTLLMNDNIISNTYIIKDIFLNDNYDSLINFAKTPYNTRFHKYSERTKERRVTYVSISIKKKNKNS
ncbi:conserved Plasmodium protein, unknown function [Plasmodium berghei]|uniref:DNA/RNA-binding protein Alba-like domain-containing protein n=2 Tax=Plasmodium berghei TaxID=5821 RepID=A0A509AF24_PLABA|nr:conserved Plasmodium protein, unknown function [Plasmodium berghei ANKA]CXH96163.1 conserved Plasmodium protein, unknown function [Plasmodium berghei]SCL91110.1 conserved Plasmodium protein, unknown function [Plasmodium berghei]SCM15426.1 conserved Plasmodium protein, unknown function [Plasmodium berghei]SCN22306.1 conserved Plasmodium protein, unknown function [Plasmodium berghei]VUC54167.1 conserved Plasmodium protein, unknown function [Plasmodium berghei ANKA]|eukprot:XP_034420012.1 conserved Plasmodium protein, unknown function [Plasmodium berghei ANKA]